MSQVTTTNSKKSDVIAKVQPAADAPVKAATPAKQDAAKKTAAREKKPAAKATAVKPKGTRAVKAKAPATKKPTTKKPTTKKKTSKKAATKSKQACEGMRVIVETSTLVRALKPLRKIGKSTGLFQDCSLVLNATKKGGLRLSSTDLSVYVDLAVDVAEVVDEGVAAVDVSRLFDAASKSAQNTLILELIAAKSKDDNAKLRIRDDVSQTDLYAGKVADAPKWPAPLKTAARFMLTGAALSEGLHEASYAVAGEHSRYAINGVLLKKAKDAKTADIVSTDGRRLVIVNVPCEAVLDEVNCIIPAKSASLLTDLLEDDGNMIELHVCEGPYVSLTTSRFRFVSQLVEGAFPPYRDVVPDAKKAEIEAVVAADSFARAVSQAEVVLEEKTIIVNFTPKGVVVEAKDSPGSADVKGCPVESYKGKSMTVGFNGRYLRDITKHATGALKFYVEAPNKPLRVDGKWAHHVLMPVNLK